MSFNNQRRGNRNGGFGFQNNSQGLLGEPPGMSMNRNKPGMGGGLGILGSGPDQQFVGMGSGSRSGMPGLGSGSMGNNMNQSLGNNFGGMNQGGNNMNQNLMGGGNQQLPSLNDSRMAAMRDSQLQLVSNLIQQQGTVGSGGSNLMGSGGSGLMNSSGPGSGLLGSGGSGLMGSNGMMGSGGSNMMGSGGSNMMGSGVMNSGGMGMGGGMGSNSGLLGTGGGGMMQNPQGVSPGGGSILGIPGGSGGMGGVMRGDLGRNQGGPRQGNIPSIFDISTEKGGLLGKRINFQRDNHGYNKRMRPNQPQGSSQQHGQQQKSRQYQGRRNERNDQNRRGRSRERDNRSSRSSSKYSDPSPSSRGSRDRRESESSQQSRASKKEPEEYDPAEPTEEDDLEESMEMSQKSQFDLSNASDILQDTRHADDDQGSQKDEEMGETQEGDSNLTVTVTDDGRSVNDSQKEPGSAPGSSEKKTNFYCHACCTECRTEEGFTNHMNGKKHKLRMDSLVVLHQQKSKQLAARMKAEEHLRKIEGKPRSERRSSESGRSSDGLEGERPIVHATGRPSRFSSYNDRQSWGSPGRHRQPQSGSAYTSGIRSARVGNRQKRSQETWPQCKVCDQIFKSPQKYIRHLKTPHHLQNIRDRNRSKRDSILDFEEEDEAFPDIDELVTLDTIGFEDDLMDKEDGEENDTENERSDQSSSPLTIKEYDPNVPVGQKYVIPVSGFFCKLCHRFYNTENAAKNNHCKSQAHYDKYQKIIMTKILSQQIQEDMEKKDQKVEEENISATETTNGQNEETVLDLTEPPVKAEDSIKEECDVTAESVEVEEAEEQQQQQEEAEEEQPEVTDVKSPGKPAKGVSRGRGRRGRRGRSNN